MRKCLLVLAACAFVYGTWLRFREPQNPVAWADDVHSSLYILGHSESELLGRLADQTVRAGTLHLGLAGSALDALKLEVKEAADHPPLYYQGARLWVWLFGAGSLRAFSGLAGLLAVALFALVAWSLYGTAEQAAIAFALASVSPAFVAWSRELREYELWTAAFLACHFFFLEAYRGRRPWGLYGLACAVALYVFPLTVAVMGGHLAFLLLRKYPRPAPWLACGASLLAFMPWLVVMFRGWSEIERVASWRSVPWPLSEVLGGVAASASWMFYANVVREPFLPLLGCAFAACAAALLWKRREAALFLGCAFLACTLPFLLLDLVLGGSRSMIPRYALPSTAALLLAFPRKVALPLLVLGAVASARISGAPDVWWHYQGRANAAVAEKIRSLGSAELVAPLRLENGTLNFHAVALAQLLGAEQEVSLFTSTPRAHAANAVVLGHAIPAGRESTPLYDLFGIRVTLARTRK